MFKNKVSVCLIFSLVIAILGIVLNSYRCLSKNTNQKEMIDKASILIEDQLYYDAINILQDAVKIGGNLTSEANKKIAEISLLKNDTNSAMSILENSISTYKDDVNCYLMLAKLQIEGYDYSNGLKTLKKGITITNDKSLIDYYEKVRYKTVLTNKEYDEILLTDDKLFVAKLDDEYLFISKSGDIYIDYRFNSLGELFNSTALNEKFAFAIDEGNLVLVDSKIGRRCLNKTDKVSKVRNIMENTGAVKMGNKWRFTNEELRIGQTDFDDIFPMSGNLIPVCKNNKWGFLDTSLKEAIPYSFDKIISTENKSTVSMERFFAVKNKKVYLYNTKGQKITDEYYDNAYPFIDGYAAVRKNSSWFFIDTSGKRIDKKTYTNLKSFSNGLAPFENGGKWGYLSLNNVEVIKCQFNDATPFYNGIATVKDGDKWKIIRLLEYDN